MGEQQVWTISVKIPTPEMRETIELAVKRDFLLYEGRGMNAENVSEWVRFLINRRLTDMKSGRRD